MSGLLKHNLPSKYSSEGRKEAICNIRKKKKEVESAFGAAWAAKLSGLRFFDLSTVAKNAP